MTIRLLCTNGGTLLVPPLPLPTQRAYTATRGQLIDVPSDLTGDAAVLLGYSDPSVGKYFALVAASGTTAQRPLTASITPGFQFTDTTVGAMIGWDGANWRNLATGASV